MRIRYKYASWAALAWSVAALVLGLRVSTPACAAADDSTVQEAREALRVRDQARLLAARDALLAAKHPLAPWADYWYFQARLGEASPSEVDAFLARWPDSYVADRARNDWLLELGRRQDWATFLRIQPMFRMNDDREVSCLGVLARQQRNVPMEALGDWRDQARQAWWRQKDADYGCDAMAQGLLQAHVLDEADVWRKLRLSMELDRGRAVQQSAKLLGDAVAKAVDSLMSQPQLYLMPPERAGALHAGKGADRHAPGSSLSTAPSDKHKRKAKAKHHRPNKKKPDLTPLPLPVPPQAQGPLNLLAFIRWAGMDPVAAAAAIEAPGNRSRWHWNSEETAWAWAQLGRAAAWRLLPQAPDYFERALADRTLAAGTGELGQSAAKVLDTWSPDTLAWMARSAVRSALSGRPTRWALVEQAVDAMEPDQQGEDAWLYWKAQAWQARARQAGDKAARDALLHQARGLLRRVADPLTFYGQLASEELNGAPPRAPPQPVPPTEAELAEAQALPGIDRALRMLALGWRSEGVREWNYTLSFGRVGGLNERTLLAVAELACQREIWDRCINSSERTRMEINLAQRYPTPFKEEVQAAAREVGLDDAYMYGLIRQESRFIVAARSNVGAAGLMQVMPATAAWTARKLAIDYHPDRIAHRETNLRIGAGYLKLVLDDFEGKQAMAAAAYNAGPRRPRRWRDGPRIDAAAWVENIPFNETRDYVKKVLANATVYSHILDGKPLSLRARLGGTIGPRVTAAPPDEADLP